MARKKNRHKKALVLNADYSPIGLVGWQSAITMDFKGLVRVLDFYDDDKIVCSGDLNWPCPAVVVLRKYKKLKKKIPFSRKNVFIRDRLTCQYCEDRFDYEDLTFDHIIPRSRFKGKRVTCWENIVSCCYPCNHKKADMTPEECGMKPLFKPVEPNPRMFVLGLSPWTLLQKEWVKYLPSFYMDLLEVED